MFFRSHFRALTITIQKSQPNCSEGVMDKVFTDNRMTGLLLIYNVGFSPMEKIPPGTIYMTDIFT